MATSNAVAAIAEAAVRARRAGHNSYVVAGITFNLAQGGYCARFVRQCYEAAIGRGEWTWPYNAPNALEMERKLRADGRVVSVPQPGDIVGLSTAGTAPGHIAIWLGDGMVAENTSSAKRGDPRAAGTKITPLSAIGSGRVTAYYRALPAVVEPNLRDVDAWAQSYVDAAVGEGIMTGYPDGSFRGRKALTRQEAAVIVTRLIGRMEARHD